MEKGNVKLKDLVSLISPAGRIRVFREAAGKQEEIYNGYRANLIHDVILQQDHEVKYFALVPEFCRRQQEKQGIKAAEGGALPVTPETAGEYAYSDLCMRLYTDIYLF